MCPNASKVQILNLANELVFVAPMGLAGPCMGLGSIKKMLEINCKQSEQWLYSYFKFINGPSNVQFYEKCFLS
jgi:hypothetical protein